MRCLWLLVLLGCDSEEAGGGTTPFECTDCRDAAPMEAGRTLGVGGECQADLQCASGLCHDDGQQKYCSERCESACPSDEEGKVYDCLGGICTQRDRDYKWLVLVDASTHEIMGTAGADICAAWAVCPVGEAEAVQASLGVGEGLVCDGSEGCGVDRTEPNQLLDEATTCALDTEPSDFVSLGLEGELGFLFDRGLRGCTVTIVDLPADGDPEDYAVYVCKDELLLECIGDAPLWEVTEGGAFEFLVP